MGKELKDYSYYFAKTNLLVSALEIFGYSHTEVQETIKTDDGYLRICHYGKDGESRFHIRTVRNSAKRTMIACVNVRPEYNHDEILKIRKMIVLKEEQENCFDLMERVREFLRTIKRVEHLLDLYYKNKEIK
ncbi:MAG: hypothetical protein QF441_16125 [Bacteriovoracaceae bacterium]|jgi:hypothetical protein|nr:hypothetical protein [Bacteriovoracaceae bacterium]